MARDAKGRIYNVSLITGINPAKEFIPILSVSEGTWVPLRVFEVSRATDARRKLVRYFPRTCTKYLCRYANFIPLGATGASPLPSSVRPNPSKSPALSHARSVSALSRLTSMFPRTQVPNAWYYRSVLSATMHE